ncbi:MAG TPA: cupin domain-containing protein [Candidatus Acidoferrales bacterium]|nr:cupin domain-containing protein [Candidatus Acidoferrales bacterium]
MSKNAIRDSGNLLTRRQLFGAASLAAAGLAAGSLADLPAVAGLPAAVAAPPQQKKGHEPLLPFKYDIEHSVGWTGEAGSAKEANVDEFPISNSIAGVSMRLKPGGLRELHWHAIAAEWAYLIEGNVRTTVISPNGQAESADFGPGDVWYFPKGHGHAIQCLGPGEAHFILAFDDGHFSEFGTFSITDWLSLTPPEIVARNLGLPVSTIQGLPRGELYITQGKAPPALPEQLRNGDPVANQFPHKFRLGAMKPVEFPGGTERIVSSVEFPIQTTMTGSLIDLKPGGLRELHWHPNADEWQYYISGSARVGIFGAHGRELADEFGPGQIAFIQQGFGHYIQQVGDQPTRILIVFNSGFYQEISISGWLAANPPAMLADNFRLTREQVAKLPTAKEGILG